MEFSESFDAILNWKGPQSSALEQPSEFTPLRKIDENFQEEEDILTQWRRERNKEKIKNTSNVYQPAKSTHSLASSRLGPLVSLVVEIRVQWLISKKSIFIDINL